VHTPDEGFIERHDRRARLIIEERVAGDDVRLDV
jgi:hypothetical protein